MIRLGNWRTVISVAVILYLGLRVTPLSFAEGPPSPPLGVAPRPLGENPAVAMSSLQMDAHLRDSQGRTTVSVRCRYRLRNTYADRSVETRIGFPLRVDDAPGFDLAHYQGFALTLNGQSLRPEPPMATLPYYVVSAKLQPKGVADVTVEYSMDLGETPAVDLRYDWRSAAAWDGSVGSARIALHLPRPTIPEQVLSQDPGPSAFDGETITWDGVDFEPEGQISISVIAPALWQDICDARQAIAGGRDTAAEHYRLASLYVRLDSHLGPAFPGGPGLYAEILSHLLQAQKADPAFVVASEDLATLYLSRATQDELSAHHYLSLAAGALQAVLAQRPGDESARLQLADTYRRLAVATRQQGDYRMALTYFDKALGGAISDERAGTEGPVGQEIETTYLAWTADLLSRGQIDEALEIVAEHMGEDPVPRYGKYRPTCAAMRGQISIGSGSREGRFVFTPYGDSAAIEGVLGDLVASLDAVQGCDASISLDGEDVVVLVSAPFEDTEGLTETLRAMEAAFPAGLEEPAQLLIRSAMLPTSVWVAEAEIPLVMDGGYRESVDLTAPAAALDVIRERTNWAIMDLGGHDPEDERGKALRDVSLGLLKKYARSWQRQREETRIDYEVGFVSSFAEPQIRRWSLSLGRTEDLRWSVRLYDQITIVRLLFGLIAVLGLLLLLVRLGRRRRERF